MADRIIFKRQSFITAQNPLKTSFLVIQDKRLSSDIFLQCPLGSHLSCSLIFHPHLYSLLFCTSYAILHNTSQVDQTCSHLKTSGAPALASSMDMQIFSLLFPEVFVDHVFLPMIITNRARPCIFFLQHLSSWSVVIVNPPMWILSLPH